MNDLPTTYLGDAVYAVYNGGYILLKLNDHRSEPLIALEEPVLQQLVAFARQNGFKIDDR